MSVGLSKTRRRNDIKNQEFRFEYDQPVIINVVADYKPSSKWTFGAKWSYHSGNLTTPIVGSTQDANGRYHPIYGELNTERLPAFHRLDLRADQIITPRLSVYYEITNAYNHDNIDGYSYSENYQTRKPAQGLGFMPNIGMEYKF